MDQLYEQEAESFQTLGHPIRLRLLSLLTESGRCACELQPELEVEVDQSTIARHLLALKRAGSAGIDSPKARLEVLGAGRRS